jgi:gamma-glutamylcyclotransferase (GGCT)/AIG2-like uncharacterized protein YtfP
VCARIVAMSASLSQLWSKEPLRRSLIAALRSWNSNLRSGSVAGQQNAAGLLEELLSSPATERVETPLQAVDRLLDFPSHRLSVYGSLAPGKKNHHMMADMEGTWRKAVLRGSLRNEGWGAGQGFPGFLWDGSNAPVAAQVFSSRDLPRHWQRLDDFEGAEYQRILVPVEVEDAEIEVCNVYALAKKSGDRT